MRFRGVRETLKTIRESTFCVRQQSSRHDPGGGRRPHSGVPGAWLEIFSLERFFRSWSTALRIFIKAFIKIFFRIAESGGFSMLWLTVFHVSSGFIRVSALAGLEMTSLLIKISNFLMFYKGFRQIL